MVPHTLNPKSQAQTCNSMKAFYVNPQILVCSFAALWTCLKAGLNNMGYVGIVAGHRDQWGAFERAELAFMSGVLRC